MRIDIDILGQTTTIDCAHPALGDTISTLFAGFRCDQTGTADRALTISSDLEVTGLDDLPVYGDPGSLAAGLEHALLREGLLSSDHLPLHAGVIGLAGRTVLLIGGSGTGKTTLTLGLVDRGHTFFSDEAGPLDPSTGHVAPFHRCPAASDDTMALLGWRPESIPHARIKGVSCIDPTAFDAIARTHSPIDHVVFVTRTVTTSMKPVDASLGMSRLIALSPASERKAGFETAARISERARFWNLGNGNFREAITRLEEITE